MSRRRVGTLKSQSHDDLNMNSKGPITRRRIREQKQTSKGVTKLKRCAKSKVKTAKTAKGRTGKQTKSAELGQVKCSPADRQTGNESAVVDATPGSSNSSLADTSLVTPVPIKTLQIFDIEDETYYVHDLVFVKPDIMVVVSVWGLVKAIDIHLDKSVLSQLQLSGLADLSKVDDNTVVLFTRFDRVEVAKVRPKLKVTKSVKLDKRYKLLRVLDKETLVGVREKEADYSLDLLNMDGTLTKRLRPNILKGVDLQQPEYLFVSSQKHIILIDGLMKLVLCFHSGGKSGFVYNGIYDWELKAAKNMGAGEYLKSFFFLRYPNSVAVDSRGNFYVADMYRGVVVKVDPTGNFVQNLLPLTAAEMGGFEIQVHIDEKDRLYVSGGDDRYGSVVVYKI